MKLIKETSGLAEMQKSRRSKFVKKVTKPFATIVASAVVCVLTILVGRKHHALNTGK